MSPVKEESKKLDLNYAVTRALDGIASKAKQSEERLQSFESRLGDTQVSLIPFYICAILNRACRKSQQI
jgi:hypothetical protein